MAVYKKRSSEERQGGVWEVEGKLGNNCKRQAGISCSQCHGALTHVDVWHWRALRLMWYGLIRSSLWRLYFIWMYELDLQGDMNNNHIITAEKYIYWSVQAPILFYVRQTENDKVVKCIWPLNYIHCFMLHQGERLSHAVGCAFAACLERKQRREKECGVTASFDASRTSFVREGSFRANSSCSQQGSSSERDDKLPDKKKGSRTFQSLSSTPYTVGNVSWSLKC